MGQVSLEPGRSPERNGDRPVITSHPPEIENIHAGTKYAPHRNEETKHASQVPPVRGAFR
jgi:hypothetical protein